MGDGGGHILHCAKPSDYDIVITTLFMRLYKQQARFALYTCALPGIAAMKPMEKYLPANYGDMWLYFTGEQCTILLQEDRMKEISRVFLNRVQGAFPEEWVRTFHEIDEALTRASREVSLSNLESLSLDELLSHYRKIIALQLAMWDLTIFIDALDAGGDADEIERIRLQYGFTPDEVQTLLSPTEPSYISFWERSLFEVKEGRLTARDVAEKFFWYGTDYVRLIDITEEGVLLAADQAHAPLVQNFVAAQTEILGRHALQTNPFGLFQTLALWRDDRKRVNFTGLYGLCKLLGEGLRRQDISTDLLYWLLPSEAEGVFLGSVDREVLAHRKADGTLAALEEDGGIVTLTGDDARKEMDRLSRFLPKKTGECKGMVASKGMAQGTVRVIADPHSLEAARMQEGEILVTGMTRPEFLPLMKKAGAIVTDEGGISCHAAIVARELQKPCIIGTKNATEIFKTGDEVEVDAEKGIVRKLS